MRIEGTTFHGFAQGASFGGIAPGGFASVCYQVSGNRVVALIDLAELSEVYCKHTQGAPHTLSDRTNKMFHAIPCVITASLVSVQGLSRLE